jgi:hypothetical protein
LRQGRGRKHQKSIDSSGDYGETFVAEAVGEPPPNQEHDTLTNSAEYKPRKSSVYGMSPEKYNRLRAIGCDPVLQWSSTVAHIVSETDRQLERLARCVREGKCADEAANFCRWLQFSGVLTLPHADFAILRKKAECILQQVGEIYKGGKVKPTYDASDIAAINAKLDVLLGNKALPVVTVDTVERKLLGVTTVSGARVRAEPPRAPDLTLLLLNNM